MFFLLQKTKVDLEVAISGIDALLKSQELVFGLVGVTPGVLVTIGVLRYLRGVFGGRKGVRRGKKADQITMTLREIDHILYTAAKPSGRVSQEEPYAHGLLSFEHRGLLVCEVHVLRNLVQGQFPSGIEKRFLKDLDEMVNAKPIFRQRENLDRLRWAYAKWLQ